VVPAPTPCLAAPATTRSAIVFPAALAATEDPEIAALRGAEVSRFETRRTALAGRQAILRRRVAELQEEIGGLEAEIASQSEQQRLIDEEARSVADLVGRGRAQIEGQRAQNQAAIARARQAIGEAELQILSLASTRQDEIATELGSMRAELLDIDEQLRASADVLARTVIAVPVAGTVVGLRFRTPGGVIGAGEPILDLVPADDQLLVRRPGDADRHRHHRQRAMPRIEGQVRQISADSLTDPKTGQTHFAARIEIDREQLRALAPEVDLTPGMPAEVLILTGSRTLLEALLEPVRAVFRRAPRET
jgi:membrane fusion protein, type I secretion system